MATAGPRHDQKQATRQALKDAALASFAANGWDATSVGTIARAAGVAHGTFYVHFDTKETLADELLADFNAALEARLRPIWAGAKGGTVESRVRRTAVAFLDHWHAERAFVRAYAQRLGGAPRLETLRDGVNPPAVQLVTALLESLVGSDARSAARVALASQGLLALWLRIGLQVLFGPEVAREDAVDTLTRMTLGAAKALRAKPAGARSNRQEKRK